MKKNNKGFSLVELIVVVLIMGIIAVALAPQVMKWVGTARENSDTNTKKDIKSAVQVAVADFQSQGGKFKTSGVTAYSSGSDVYEFEFSSTGVAELDNDMAELADCIAEVTGEDYSSTKADKSKFTVIIDTKGVVTVQ